MTGRTIRYIIFLATVAILGITVIQAYWVRQAVNLEKSEFLRNVNLALFEVAENFYELTNNETPQANPIIKLADNNYVVMINGSIDANLLEVLLKRSFSSHNLYTDFEYGVYNSVTSEQVYSDNVKANPGELLEPQTDLPVFNDSEYYFGVYFPSNTSLLFNQLQVWVYSTFILLAVIIFFAYALFVILKQKRLSEVQKDFINNMTHEFKTPISTIEIAAEVLKDPAIKERPDRLLKYATIIENENRRLKKQVDKVLQIASLEKGTIVLKKERIDMHQLIQQVVDQQGPSASPGRVSTKFLAGKYEISVDTVHITNVVYNLLDNAIKYCDKEPEITVHTSYTDNTEEYFTMRFQDNGVGISPEYQQNIFSKFYRIPTGDVHDTKGFGIGLHYVNLIVEAHGGTISLQSEEGKGSTFTIKLPL